MDEKNITEKTEAKSELLAALEKEMAKPDFFEMKKPENKKKLKMAGNIGFMDIVDNSEPIVDQD